MPNDKNKKTRKKRPVEILPESLQQEAARSIRKRVENQPEAFDLPKSNRTIDELTDYFVKSQEGANRILPKEKRRYAIYLRKSTDDEAKQVRSLEDQRTECLTLANDILKVSVSEEDIFEESASAKKSGNRPIFDDILVGFKTGKYHGLIAWSPDRLSRNMKEAGEIIEMIDMEQIQDLHFKTYQFDNTPNGKMLLGILFATSKQYSDKLSVDVKRGNTGNIRDGKYTGVIKKGYYADIATGYFVPDGYNWQLLREAVVMRLYQNKSNPEIVKHLNDSNFTVRKDQDSDYKVYKFTKTSLGKVFEDSFYFGLYSYGDNLANLGDLYNFLPLITADEHIALNQKVASDFGKKAAGRNAGSNDRLGYGLLRGKVICDYCDAVMQFQHQEIKRGKNKGRWLISFYCRNKDECIRHDKARAIEKYGAALPKSVRAQHVMAYIEYTLRSCTKKSQEAYRIYHDRLELKLAKDKAVAKRKLKASEADLKKHQTEYARYQNFQVDHPAEYKRHHDGKLEYYGNLVSITKHTLETNRKELKALDTQLPTRKQFDELTNSYLETLLKTKDLMEIDIICNEVVSNLRVGNNAVSVIKLNPPYDLMVDLSKVSIGRGDRT